MCFPAEKWSRQESKPITPIVQTPSAESKSRHLSCRKITLGILPARLHPSIKLFQINKMNKMAAVRSLTSYHFMETETCI